MKDIQFTCCMYIKQEIYVCSMCLHFEIWSMYSNNYAICKVIIAKQNLSI